jgi:PKHD-type hydroxylase
MPHILSTGKAPIIFEYANFFTDTECETIIDIGENLNPEFGSIYNGKPGGAKNGDVRRCGVSWIKPSDDTSWIFQKIQHAVNEINQTYYKFSIQWGEDCQFTKYDSSYQGFFSKHLDIVGFSGEAARKISISIILNEDYDGGELKIYTDETPFIVKKSKGTLALFPSFLLHEVTPVTSGTRYSLVNWINGTRWN